MAIYVGDNKALMLKSDRSIAKLFKGDNVIFDYDATAEGEIVTIANAHSIEHNLEVKLKSRNLFDADAVLPSLTNPSFPNYHWKKQADGSFYLFNLGLLEKCVWFENTKGYKGQFSFSITTKANNGTGANGTLQIVFVYTDGSKESLIMKNVADYTTYTFVTNANKTLSYIYQTYNSSANTYIKDIMIAYGTDTTYTPYMTDFSGVNVTRCGKNIFDADAVLPSLENPNFPGLKWVKQADGSFYSYNVGGLEGYTWFENTSGYEGQFSVSMSVKTSGLQEGQNSLQIFIEYTDGTKDVLKCYHNEEFETLTITSNQSKIVLRVYQSYGAPRGAYIKDIMIAYGTDTEYEPYSPLTVTANADGTVEGLTSTSPNMTLFTDADGVVINCEYVKG